MMELVPSIDLRNGRVVRLRQGVFASEIRYKLTPRQLYRRYAAAGARYVHIVDLDGARDGVAGNRATLRSLAALEGPRIQAGGGVRSLADVVRHLADGVERVVAGSVAIESPRELVDWIRRFGADRVVAALDVRLGTDGTPRLVSHGWQRVWKRSLWDALEEFARAGLKHVLCTDVARDGAMAGPNVKLYRECVKRFPSLAWQTSGGVRNAADLHALSAIGVAAAISGKALLEDRITQQELAPFLPAA
jgi:phosphoribosylformimino-5-aminoimidazole carboxamide ribotide isomerase